MVNYGGVPVTTAFSVPFLNLNSATTSPANYECQFQVAIPVATTITGITIYNGGAAAGNVIVGLRNSSGNLVASSVSTAQSASTYLGQFIPFTSPYAAAARIYYVCVIPSSGVAQFGVGWVANNAAQVNVGSFTLPASSTVPSATGTGAYCITASTYLARRLMTFPVTETQGELFAIGATGAGTPKLSIIEVFEEQAG